MDLTHRFTVPTSVEQTWSHFTDVASVAECFPGAQVTSVDGETFQGTCKVKLGPIALVYSGSGRFVERDEAAHRFVVEARGKDKRGNGTAGATVTVAMAAAAGQGEATDVEVVTDLTVTGKPAQFGRGVMQDVSDKLLGQFVACLEEHLSGGADTTAQDAGPASAPSAPPAVPPPPDAHSGQGAGPAPAPPDPPPAAPRHAARPDDALDLGATVLPVLARSYWRQASVALGVLLALRWLLRRRASR